MNTLWRKPNVVLCFVVMVISCLMSFSSADAQVWRQLSPAVGYNVGINPLNSNTIYCERNAFSLWVSRDRGVNWTSLGATPITGIRHILIHPKDTLTMFVVNFSGGLWRSTNEGASWTSVLATSFGGNLGAYGIDGESMDYDPTNTDTMFAGNFSDGAVYRSLDRGATWSFMGLSGATALCALNVRPDSTNILYAGTGLSTLSKSTDYGVTWTIKLNGGTQEVPKIVIHPNNPLIAYATTNSNGIAAEDPLCNVWKTTDGGETWFKTALQNIGNWSIAMDVQRPETLWVGLFGALATSTGMRRTTDGGTSFTTFDRGLPSKLASWNLRIHPLDPSFVIQSGTASGFFNGGGVWRFMDTSDTRVEGTVRDAITNLPVAANLQMIEVVDSIKGSSTFEFGYYAGDPTLTPTVHVTAPGYYSKDTTLYFTLNTVQMQDIHLDPLPLNSITGYAFEDANSNGVKDAGETGLSNWLVRITGPITDSMLTDINGGYSFDSLANGTYTLSEEVQSGWIQSFPACPGTHVISFTMGTSQTDINFGNQQNIPGVTIFSENFTTTTFPPPCWAVENANGGFTWLRATTVFNSAPAAARNGTGNNVDGLSNDWLFTRPVELETGKIYRLSWYDRTFINGVPSGIDSLDVAVGTSQTAAGMTQIINSRAFDTNFLYEYVEQDLTVSSNGTYYIGFHDYSAAGNTIRIDDVKLVYLVSTASSISGMKFNDLNNNNAKDGGEPGIAGWKIYLTGDVVDSAITDVNGNYFFGLSAGNYTVSEESQAGWTQTFPPSGSYNITLGSSEDLIDKDFGNFQPNSLKVRKFRDADGDFSTTGDRTSKSWHLEVRQGSVNGAVVASGDADSVIASNLIDGTYYAVEADSSGWVHIGYIVDATPTPGADTAVAVVLAGGQNRRVDFVNFHPNSLTIRKYQDADGDFNTVGDRVLIAWYVEVVGEGNSASGTVVANNLGDGNYTAQEADSAGWIHLGYVVDGVPTASTSNNVNVGVANGQNSTVDFVNAPPIYSQTFRSFKPDSIALDKDNKGKVGKYVKRKPVRVEFCALVIADSNNVNDVHMEFSYAIEMAFPFYTLPASTASNPDGKLKKWDFTFSTALNAGDSVRVYGFGNKGKPQKVPKYYWTRNGVIVGLKKKDPVINPNLPSLPMPNRINALFETFEQGGFGATNGLLVGIDKTLPVDSSKFYGWLLAPKYTDVLKSLKDKTGLHLDACSNARGLDFFANGKPLIKRQKSIPPSKQQNRLIANMVALKLNIAASALGKTPVGFGELIYQDSAYFTCTPGNALYPNQYNGMMVKDIAALADKLMMGLYDSTGTHMFYSGDLDYWTINHAISRINDAFEGPVDTIDFTTKLHLKGTKQLIEVAYLKANPNIAPVTITPSLTPFAQVPDAYSLYQNYPNPFNPTTTIAFDVPEEAFVTLKVYNVLGQEVATLFDRELLDEGAEEVEFDARFLASGVYFYRIIAEPVAYEDEVAGSSFVSVKKMLLLK